MNFVVVDYSRNLRLAPRLDMRADPAAAVRDVLRHCQGIVRVEIDVDQEFATALNATLDDDKRYREPMVDGVRHEFDGRPLVVKEPWA